VEWLSIKAPASSHVTSFFAGTQQYLIIASSTYRNLSVYSVDSVNKVKLVDNITVEGVVSAKPVYINGKVFIAVACCCTLAGSNVNSRLYDWKNDQLVLLQYFNTSWASDVDFTITPSRDVLLAFSSDHSENSFKSPSQVYKWNSSITRFELHQQLDKTTGAQKIHFFHIKREMWLVVACQYNDGNEPVNSYVYKWNGQIFEAFQVISHQFTNLYPIFTGHGVYLFGAKNDAFSIIYRLDKSLNKFRQYTTIETGGGVRYVNFFIIKSEYFIAVTKFYHIANQENSIIYRFTGPVFEKFQAIPTVNAMSLHALKTRHGCWVLAVADEGGNDVVLYRWGDVSPNNACNSY
jgi:hypothetical protein